MALVHGPISGSGTASWGGRVGSAIAFLTAAALVVAAMFLPVVQSSDATTTGYTIRHHQQDLSDLQARIHAAESAIADLGSMNRIRTEASRIGMVPADGRGVVVTVNAPPASQVLLPRRYLPPPQPDTGAAGQHSLLSSLLDLLSLR
jgi:uncharacterized protein YlxW (UPF0749 family)